MKVSSIISNHWVRRFLALLVVDGLFFSMVNPKTAPSILVVAGFILILMTLYVLVRLTLGVVMQRLGMPERITKKIVLLVAVLLGVILGMQSIGQLSARDLLAIVPLIVVLYFYLSYSRPN